MGQKYIPTYRVDITFNSWWNVYGNKRETVQRALDETRAQIGPPMRPDYVPPPWRKAPAANKATSAPSKNGAGTPSQAALRGVMMARVEMMMEMSRIAALNRYWPAGTSAPLGLLNRLAWLPCVAGGPAAKRQMEQKVIGSYFQQHPNDSYMDPRQMPMGLNFGTSVGKRRPSDAFALTDEEIEAQKLRWLQDIQWLSENKVGGAAYGARR